MHADCAGCGDLLCTDTTVPNRVLRFAKVRLTVDLTTYRFAEPISTNVLLLKDGCGAVSWNARKHSLFRAVKHRAA